MIIRSLLFMNVIWSLVHCKERAVLDIVMHKITRNGEYKTEVEKISGHFSAAGPVVSAEGDILQIHPMGICSRDFSEQMVYGWVGVMKLEKKGIHCMNLYEQAKVAIRRGATAVVFDVTEVPSAAKKLRQLRHLAGEQLERPVIIIRSREAVRLITIIQTQQDAWARIRTEKSQSVDTTTHDEKEYYNVIIFVAVIVVVCIIVISVVIKCKCSHREQQLSMSELAKQAIAKLETRKYQSQKEKSLTRVNTPTSDVYSQTSNTDACAICLEEYRENQVLRVLPCSHEFHSNCVDPWLVNHRTCPFCMFNIIEQKEERQASRAQQRDVRSTDQSQFYPLPPHTNPHLSHSQYLQYLNYHSELHNACNSCEGTVGSSISSCNSCYRQNAHNLSQEPIHRSYYRTLQQSCCTNDMEIGRVFPYNSPFVNSGISYSHHVTASSIHHHTNYCRTHKQIHNSTHHYYLGHSTRLFQYKMKNLSGRACDSEPENTSGKDISIKAHYGSCSESCSDRNPSSSSLECPDCVQSCGNVVDSNQSTFGSSETQDCSDNTSYDSNVFWGGGAPDQMCTDFSSEKTSVSEFCCQENICTCPNFFLNESDIYSGNTCWKKCDRKNSESTLNLSRVSGCDTPCSIDSNSSQFNSCQSVDYLLNLSEISGLTQDDDSSDTSSASQNNENVCLMCNNGNNSDYSSFQTNTFPKDQKCKLINHVHNMANTLPRSRRHNCVKYANCKSRSKVKVQPTMQGDLATRQTVPWTDHDREEEIINDNTQGDSAKLLLGNNQLCKATRTICRQKTSARFFKSSLLENFRLSKSCDILPTENGSSHCDHVIEKQAQPLTKDSVVMATSQGSTITVFLDNKDHMCVGNAV